MDHPTIAVVHHPDRELAHALSGLVERLAGQPGPVVGERKRVQLQRLDDTPWSAVLATGGDGAWVGYAHLRWEHAHPGGLVASVELAVDGDDDVASDDLLAAARAAIADAGGGRWQLWAHQPVAVRAAERAGLALARRLLLMHAPLTDELPALAVPPTLPEGVTLAPLRDGVDDAALIQANNAAFADHPEQGGWSPAELEIRRAAPWYDPTDVLLAWWGQRLLGFHWTKRHPPDQRELAGVARLGEVYVLAVHPRAQGMGLGRALLRAGVTRLAERGCSDAALYVDVGEPAVSLYEREGFETARVHRCYVGHELGSDGRRAAT